MTVGAIMFYGGIGLFAAALAGMIIANVILSSKWKKLRRLMHDRYGD